MVIQWFAQKDRPKFHTIPPENAMQNLIVSALAIWSSYYSKIKHRPVDDLLRRCNMQRIIQNLTDSFTVSSLAIRRRNASSVKPISNFLV